jgi:hypothetical protein
LIFYSAEMHIFCLFHRDLGNKEVGDQSIKAISFYTNMLIGGIKHFPYTHPCTWGSSQ